MFNELKLFFVNWRNGLVGSHRFQKWAGNTPVVRAIARKDGEKIYDLMAGFVYSQTLLAMVELDIFNHLKGRSLTAVALSQKVGVPEKNMIILCQSATAINLLERLNFGQYALSRLGASVLGVPGLIDMIRHHRLFYEDLIDPVSLLKNKVDTHMSKYWPYVLNKTSQKPLKPEVAEIYSDLMRSSQKLVAEETLRLISFSRTKHLLDIGGGTGAFIEEVSKVTSGISFCLFDLPQVVDKARKLTLRKENANNFDVYGGSFVTDKIPKGFDTITLIRVLYDHDDHIVTMLLKKIYDSLPKNGQIIISEPMSGGKFPTRSGDSYFGFYTMAMTTGRPRSAEIHEFFLRKAGFQNIKKHKGTREFITQVITAKKKF
ncbi:MAG: methyltransferase [Paracoccaceae bacterium]|nr:methyltransferase [Paracoccaceae bacterium]